MNRLSALTMAGFSTLRLSLTTLDWAKASMTVRQVRSRRARIICLDSLMKGHSSDPVDLQLLDPVTVLAFADEDRDLEKFSPGIEIAKGVLGVGS